MGWTYGKEKYDNGARYEGEFKDGQREGFETVYLKP